jgi:hypothetical protein
LLTYYLLSIASVFLQSATIIQGTKLLIIRTV